MKKYIFLWAFGLSLTACQTTDVPAVFKEPTVELISVFSTSDTEAEVSLDLSEVYQNVSSVGVVWADKSSPTLSDRILELQNVETDQLLSFQIPNLQKNKTYYFKAYYKLNDKVVYGNEVSLVQNYTGQWQRLKSPTFLTDEYIYPDNTRIDSPSGQFILSVYRVNRFTNQGLYQSYFPGPDVWNPNFWGNQNPNPRPFPMLFSPINAQFTTSNSETFSFFGAGYQMTPNGRRLYQRNMSILESSGSWEPYPGAEAPTASFGIGRFVYALENLPNGQLWQFDSSVLKWKSISTSPYNKPARLIGFDVGERAFILVEPFDNQTNIEFYEYLAAQNSWIKRTPFAGDNRRKGAKFVINNRLYYGMGQTPTGGKALRDFWEYDPAKNTWQRVADYPGTGTIDLLAQGLGNGAFIGFGQQVRSTSVGGEIYRTATDFWRFRR